MVVFMLLVLLFLRFSHLSLASRSLAARRHFILSTQELSPCMHIIYMHSAIQHMPIVTHTHSQSMQPKSVTHEKNSMNFQKLKIGINSTWAVVFYAASRLTLECKIHTHTRTARAHSHFNYIYTFSIFILFFPHCRFAI